jgi:hypothetical protein
MGAKGEKEARHGRHKGMTLNSTFWLNPVPYL